MPAPRPAPRPALPSLHALSCFDAAARHVSMSAAARELHLTHGAISRQVTKLEGELGAALFVRAHRRLALTREGTALAAAVARALDVLRDGVREVAQVSGGPLVLSCEPTLTVAWLVPRLGRLPGDPPLELLIHQGGGPIDLVRSGADLALRRADFDFGGAPADHVMDEWIGPVCAPRCAVALRRGEAAALVHSKTRPAAWTDWAKRTGRAVPRGPSKTFDHFATTLQVAVAGLGVAMGPFPLAAAEIAAGRLVAPFGFVRGDAGYHLLGRSPVAADPRVASLLAWLRKEARTMDRALAPPDADGARQLRASR